MDVTNPNEVRDKAAELLETTATSLRNTAVEQGGQRHGEVTGVHGRELWRTDDAPPTAAASTFNYAANPATLTVTFSEGLTDLTLADWKLTDRATGRSVASG